MRFIYTMLVYVLRPFAAALVLWRGLRNRGYWQSLPERFGMGSPVAEPAVWVHAVSLGEVTAAAPVILALRQQHPLLRVVLTTATPTGRARARALFGDGVAVRYLPYDTPGSMRRFLARVRPRAVIVMETELWPNLFAACRRRSLPVVLASARMSASSAARYARFGALFRDVLANGTWVAAQTEEDAARFLACGAAAERVQVIGNVKFDLQTASALAPRGAALRAAWPARPAWIAGSTHAGEEDMVLAAHATVLAELPAALLLVVPRHPERFAAVADLIRRRGYRCERRSSLSVLPSDALLPADCAVLLVDTVGELGALYAAADVAFVGGSLVPVGGHNLLEPAALGVPVVTGPHVANAREIAQLLHGAGAAVTVHDAAELAAAVRRWLVDGDARRRAGAGGLAVVAANRGSVARLLEMVTPLLVAAAAHAAHAAIPAKAS